MPAHTFRTHCWVLILCFLSGLGQAELRVVELSPAQGAKNVCIDTPLRIVFGEAVVAGGKGRVMVRRAADQTMVDAIDLGSAIFTNSFGGKTLRYEPFTIESNTVSIQLHSRCLEYDQAYYVEVEPGVFKDEAGKDFAGLNQDAEWKFGTKAAVAKGKAGVIVAADQSGDFCALQGAIDSIPDDNQVQVNITIRKGVYNGIVHVGTGKNHLRIMGEDRKGTVLQGLDNDRLNTGRGGRALLGVDANDFILENLTVHNTTPYKGSQAEALRINGERCIVRNADLLSFQDTLMLGGRVYVTNCYVEGDVDFIWGPGIAFFEDCELKAMHTGYYLQARNPVGQAGYVFSNCRLTSAPGVDKCWLARIHSERFSGSQVAFLNCKMGAHIMPAAWVVEGTNYAALRFQEFHNTDLEGSPLDTSKRHPASRQLTVAEAATLSDPAKVFAYPETWDPRQATGGTSGRVFEVREFGAKGDGKTLDTAAIQTALDECGKAGGGVVRLAPGTYLSKPIYLRSKTALQLDEGATLLATDERADYLKPGNLDASPSSASFVAFVNGKDLTDVAIVGKGTIDGSGARWWGPAKEAKRTHTENPGYTLPRPKLVVLTVCKNVRLQGVTLANSPCFHFVPVDCEDVNVEDVTILAPADSPNTDGIDPSVSRRVRISRCRIDVGDDNIAIKSGHRLPGRDFACEDITVTDCTFLHGHGMSIGSETAGGVRHLNVSRCTFEGTANGIRIKSPRGRGGAVEDLTYTEITMKDVDPAITITCYYPKIPKEDAAQPVNAGTPRFQNIRISNLTATCARNVGTIVGLPESPVSGVVLKNVNITATTGLLVRNAKDVQTSGLEITTKQGPPLLLENAQVDGAGSFKDP